MQQLIASYLFQTKNCPLAGMGNLRIIPTATITDFSNKLIYPPTPVIQLESKEGDASSLIGYLSMATGSSHSEAETAYRSFCKMLSETAATNGFVNWEGVGKFQTDQSGSIQFQQEELPAGFSEPVPAIRVVHPEATHQVLVGDRETTNVAMAEYFSEKPVVRDRWWIWAILLALAGFAVLIYYFMSGGQDSSFGNQWPVDAV